MRETRKEENKNMIEILCSAKWSNHDRQDCSIPKITWRLSRERKVQELCNPMQITRHDKHYSGNDFKW